MNDVEAATLLAIAAGFDRRIVTEVTARAWSLALEDRSFAECERAVIAHFKDPATRGDYLTVGHILDRLDAEQRLSANAIAADVRSAKARGMVGSDWPAKDKLPDAVMSRLREARERELLAANDNGFRLQLDG